MNYIILLLVIILFFIFEIWLKVRFLIRSQDVLLRILGSGITGTQSLLMFLIKNSEPSRDELEDFLQKQKIMFEGLAHENNHSEWLAQYNTLEELINEIINSK